MQKIITPKSKAWHPDVLAMEECATLEDLRAAHKKALRQHKDKVAIRELNTAWAAGSNRFSAIPREFPSFGASRDIAVASSLKRYCDYLDCTTLHGSDLANCTTAGCQHVYHRSCALDDDAALCQKCFDALPTLEKVLEELKQRLETPIADWSPASPMEWLQLGYEEALAAVRLLGDNPDDIDAVNAVYAREEAYIENVLRSGEPPKWYPSELRHALGTMRHALDLTSLDQARGVALKMAVGCEEYKDSVDAVYEALLGHIR